MDGCIHLHGYKDGTPDRERRMVNMLCMKSQLKTSVRMCQDIKPSLMIKSLVGLTGLNETLSNGLVMSINILHNS